MTLLEVAKLALEAMEDAMYRADTHEFYDAKESLRYAIEQAEQAEQEPVATKQMLRWVEHLKRLSDDGQHMSIPGLSSGACWELAIELEQFIKNTAPTPRKPLTEPELHAITPTWPAPGQEWDYEEVLAFVRAIERAHGIGGGE